MRTWDTIVDLAVIMHRFTAYSVYIVFPSAWLPTQTIPVAATGLQCDFNTDWTTQSLKEFKKEQCLRWMLPLDGLDDGCVPIIV
jgi:hypothetical protein